MNSFIPWVGGKSKLLWIINKMAPDHYSRFIDVFCGSGTVTMSRPIQPGCMEVYNDFNSNLTNLFCCVKNRPLALLAELGFLPLNTRDDFNVLYIDWQPGLSSGTAQAGRAWDLLRRPCRMAVDESGLRRIRSPDRHGQRKPAEYVPHLRRRLCRKDVPPDGPHRSSRQCGGPMVHRRLRGNLAGCAGGLPRTSERIYDRMR